MTSSQAPPSPGKSPSRRRFRFWARLRFSPRSGEKNQTNPIPVGRAGVPIVGPPAFFHDAAQKTKRTQFSRNSRKTNDLSSEITSNRPPIRQAPPYFRPSPALRPETLLPVPRSWAGFPLPVASERASPRLI
jgi:hypothetical protein